MKIAILDDEKIIQEQVKNYIDAFGEENNLSFNISIFSNGVDLLENLNVSYDVFLLDIDLPVMNGMEVAKKIREKNTDSIIIFITNLSNFALQGYSVQATDFILKPINYESFSFRFKRVINIIKNREKQVIAFQIEKSKVVFSLQDIIYFEIFSHEILIHTVKGNYRTYGSLKEIESKITDNSFARCDSCYLINFRFVKQIKNDCVIIGNDELKISRNKKKRFIEAFNRFII